MYAVDEGPYYTEKSTFALNGLREKTEVILAAAPRGCVSGSSVRRARPRVRPSRSAFQPLCRRGNFVSQCIECRAAPPPPPAHLQGSLHLPPRASCEDKMRLNALYGKGTTPEKWVARSDSKGNLSYGEGG